MRLDRNDNRLEQITHYVIARMPGENVGGTKLAKVLWLADIMSWRSRARSLTGIEHYKRLPFGPVPTQVRAVVIGLISSQIVHERLIDFPNGAQKKELVSLQDPVFPDLTAQDVDILRRAMDIIAPLTARQVSDSSHDEYWEEVPENGTMSVGAASVNPAELDEDDLAWAESELERLGVQ